MKMRGSFLAIGALLLSTFGLVSLLLIIAERRVLVDNAGLAGLYHCVAGIVAGHAARSRGKGEAGRNWPRSLALDAIILGHASFALAFVDALLMEEKFVLAVPAVAALVEASRLLVGVSRQHFWRTLVLAAAVGVFTWLLLGSNLLVFYPFALFGILILTILPASVCFPAVAQYSTGRKVILAGIMYLLAAGVAWRAWGTWMDYRQGWTIGWVARTKSEIRNLAVNLESYYIDQGCYPPAVDAKGKIVPLEADGSTVSAGYVPWLLTTPVPYTVSLPLDPYSDKRKKGIWEPYRYATNGITCWIMTGNGPDQNPDIKIEEYPIPSKGNCSWRSFMSHFGVGSAIEYDGTNGTTSSGDIVRVGP